MFILLFHKKARPLMVGWRLKFTILYIDTFQTVEKSKHNIQFNFQQKKSLLKIREIRK